MNYYYPYLRQSVVGKWWMFWRGFSIHMISNFHYLSWLVIKESLDKSIFFLRKIIMSIVNLYYPLNLFLYVLIQWIYNIHLVGICFRINIFNSNQISPSSCSFFYSYLCLFLSSSLLRDNFLEGATYYRAYAWIILF